MKKLYFILFSLIALSQHSFAVSEIEIKAVFLEKFTHLITWPQNKDTEFNICVVKDKTFSNTLKQVYQDKTFQEKPVNIFLIEHVEPAQKCHLLFLGKMTQEPDLYIKQFAQKPVLTVSDNRAFINNNVMITMYLKGKHFRYIINNQTANEVDIQISYLLLKSAEEVIQ